MSTQKNMRNLHLLMWTDTIDVFNLIIGGLIVGMMASAPMGPVGILVIRRTLNKGRWYGMITGLGAACSDLIYALVTGLGLYVGLGFLQMPNATLYFKILGSVMLFFFGLFSYKAKPSSISPTGSSRGTLLHNFITGFLVTLSNPLIILLFMVLFARFDFLETMPSYYVWYVPAHYVWRVFGYVAIMAGALLWWFVLTLMIDKFRARISEHTIVRVNQIIGILVMVLGVVGMFYGLYMLYITINL